MLFKQANIAGCFEIIPNIICDARGKFVKTFEKSLFSKNGLDIEFSEEYYTWSMQGVIRGLHFQIPPFEYKKTVTCLHGEILDVVVDIRKGSPTYYKYQIFNLKAEEGTMLYLPSGIAHGFEVLSDNAMVAYCVNSEYAPDYDKGIRWDSLDIPWQTIRPIISQRDQQFPSLDEFETPFIY
jgi:dTDP-4-dehydrorhamnose 3,5-epimerase